MVSSLVTGTAGGHRHSRISLPLSAQTMQMKQEVALMHSVLTQMQQGGVTNDNMQRASKALDVLISMFGGSVGVASGGDRGACAGVGGDAMTSSSGAESYAGGFSLSSRFAYRNEGQDLDIGMPPLSPLAKENYMVVEGGGAML